jgi:hypothetical protein
MSQGEYCSNILVVHPVESAWCKFSLKQGKTIDKLLESGWNSKGNSVLTDIDNRLAELTLMLIENKFEYDFGSEHLIEKYGKIEDGMFTLENGKYSAVIIPDTITLRRKTVELLVDFGRAGGVLIASDRFPSLMEGGQQDEKLFKELKQLCHTYSSLDSLMNFLDKNIERFVLVKDTNGENISKIYVHTRRLNRETSLIFLTNITADKNYSATVEILKKGALYKMNSFKGTVEKTSVSHLKDGKMGIDLVFPPVGSYMFLLNESEEPLLTKKDENKERIETQLSGWDISMKDFNVLVLDRCAFQKSTDTRWSEKMLAIEVQNEMEKTCNGERVRVLFEFKVEEGFYPKDLKLIVESIDNYKVIVNGECLNVKSSQRWIDKCFNVVDIPANFIVSGKNSIILETLFNLPKKEGTLIFKEGGTELENIYIAGDFSVEAEDIHHTADGYYHNGLKLAPSQKITDEKSVNLQGYPFYTGILFAEKQVVIDKLKGRYLLQFEQFHCTVAEVSVNGRKVGTVYLPPYQIDLTDYLKEGTNIISIECAGTLRNALGPFHLKEMFPTIVGPDSFESFETEGYANVPFGVGKTLLIQEF